MTSPKDASIVATITGTILCSDDLFHCPNAQVSGIVNPELSDGFGVRLECKVCGYHGVERWSAILANACKKDNAVPQENLKLLDKFIKEAGSET